MVSVLYCTQQKPGAEQRYQRYAISFVCVTVNTRRYSQLRTWAVFKHSAIGVPDIQKNIVIIAHVLASVLCHANGSIRGCSWSWSFVDDESHCLSVAQTV